MCGLVGIYSSNIFSRHKDALETLLYLDTFRGKDSTGVAAIRQNADTAILKSTVPGYEFIEGPRLSGHLKFSDLCWIGHNRYGTVGRNIKTNAHPFEILDKDGSCILVGAHNGTLKNKHILKDQDQFGTDSEAMFHNIAHTSVEETIALLDGAWAISYYDHIAEELRFLRNKERPLFYAYEEGKKTLIWASEMWMIRVACSRHGIKLDEDKVYTFVEDTLYCFPVPLKTNETLTCERKGGLAGRQPAFFQAWDRRGWTGGRGGQSPTSYPEAATESGSSSQAQTPGRTAIEVVTPQTSNTPSGTRTIGSGETLTTRKGGSSATPSKDKSDKVVGIETAKTFKGYAGKVLSKAEITDMLAGGCGWCETEFISLDDKFGWLAPAKPVCEKCLEGGHEEIQTPKNVSVH